MYKQNGIGQQANCFCKPSHFTKFYMRYSLFLKYFILIKYMYMYFIYQYQQSKKKVMCDAICVDMIIFCDMTI